jgi:hypothetical protein
MNTRIRNRIVNTAYSISEHATRTERYFMYFRGKKGERYGTVWPGFPQQHKKNESILILLTNKKIVPYERSTMTMIPMASKIKGTARFDRNLVGK